MVAAPELGGLVFVAQGQEGSELWRTDGTLESTFRIQTDGALWPKQPRVWGEHLYFIGIAPEDHISDDLFRVPVSRVSTR